MFNLILDLWKVSIQKSQIKKDIDDFNQMIIQIHDMKKSNMPIGSVDIDGMQDYLIGSISIIIDRKKNLCKECCNKYNEIRCKIIEEIEDIKKQELHYIDGNQIRIAYEDACVNLINFLKKEENIIDFLLIKDNPIIWDDVDCERIRNVIQKSVNP